MADELNGWARPRPLRIAFLVEEGEHASIVLDGIFADCYNRWSGRFSLIVPCVERRISPEYWPWLETYGPDIVYSYIALSADDILEIHERLAPLEYKYHRVHNRQRMDVFGFKPSYDFTPLSSLSVVFKLARFFPAAREGAPVKIIDSWWTETASQLLTDNFGTYQYSRGGGMFPTDAMAAANLMTIVREEARADPQLGVPRDLITLPNETAAFQEYVGRRATSMSLLSAQFAPHLEFHDQKWQNSMNVVLGDSFNDRLLFWNARLLTPAWLDSDLGSIRVTSEALRDVAFLSTIGDLIRQRNHFGGGGHHHVTIRSTSASAEEMEEARQLLVSTKPWGTINTERLDGPDAIVPSKDALDSATERYHSDTQLFQRPEWTHFSWTPPIARPPTKMPDHLADVPPQQIFAEGYWCADFIMEYDGAPLNYKGNNQWMLPNRWRLHTAFDHSLVGSEGPTGWAPDGWRGRNNYYSVFVNATRPVASIKLPTALEAMRSALAHDGLWHQQNLEDGKIYPTPKVGWMKPSNEARYLTGILGMTGGLNGAIKILLHPFLTDVFASLGGATRLPIDKVLPTANRLQKRAHFERTFDLRDEHEREALATLIVQASGTLKKPIDNISYEDLKQRWSAHRSAYWLRNPRQDVPDDLADWDAHEQATLESSLVEMRQRQLMFQGHQWTCTHCHHKNWIDISELSPQLTCEICKHSDPAPIDIKWLFRSNEFLINALRNHSVLSLVWTLSVLQSRCRRSFIFVEPSWFAYNLDAKSPDAEADLLVVADGATFLCEVKASWSVLRLSHLVDFVDLAKRLRPDTALLAIMDTSRKFEVELNTARVDLANVGITFELLTLDMQGLEDSPYLN